MKFSIKDFFSKRDQIRSFLRIWSHLRKKYLMENFIFCVVIAATLSILDVYGGFRYVFVFNKTSRYLSLQNQSAGAVLEKDVLKNFATS